MLQTRVDGLTNNIGRRNEQLVQPGRVTGMPLADRVSAGEARSAKQLACPVEIFLPSPGNRRNAAFPDVLRERQNMYNFHIF